VSVDKTTICKQYNIIPHVCSGHSYALQ